MQIKDYTKVNELSDNDIFLIDGNDGTRTINSVNAANALAKKVNAENARNALDYGSLGEYTVVPNDKTYNPHFMYYNKATNEYLNIGITDIRTMADDCYSVFYPGKADIIHKMSYRNKNLGSSVTDEQWEAIRNGTFENLFIGDYWEINGVNWRIVDIDYWLNIGDEINSKHHLVIMPDTILKTDVKMNLTNTTDGGYLNSNLVNHEFNEAAVLIIHKAFSKEHLYRHKECFCNGVDFNTREETGWIWQWSSVDLPNCEMLFGRSDSSLLKNRYTSSVRQLMYSILDPNFISIQHIYWLRDVHNITHFSIVGNDGTLSWLPASYGCGVRPVFGIC